MGSFPWDSIMNIQVNNCLFKQFSTAALQNVLHALILIHMILVHMALIHMALIHILLQSLLSC